MVDHENTGTAEALLGETFAALDLPGNALDRIRIVGHEHHPSCFAVTDLAVASIGAAGASVAELVGMLVPTPLVEVDRRLASLWFGWSIIPEGWSLPDPWDELAGDYRSADGWIKIHTNAPHHRAAALAALGCAPDRDAVARSLAARTGVDIETAITAAGGCAAELRTTEAWATHPQGRAVAAEPVVLRDRAATTEPARWTPTPEAPLSGIRVLDLTRVIAGPVATRFLAGFGAEVLRVDPLDWHEQALEPEVLLGKRCARLNLRDERDRRTFERLLAEADVLVHGYRCGGLDGLGLDADARQRIRPGLIDVSLDAYGHSGPWADRRGFDSLVQFATGIAAAGMEWRCSSTPVSLPVQALDHATGYLVAAEVVGAIRRAVHEGRTERARLSLARTARLLVDHRGIPTDEPLRPVDDADVSVAVERTPWGPARRLRPPVRLGPAEMAWPLPATTLGSSTAEWSA